MVLTYVLYTQHFSIGSNRGCLTRFARSTIMETRDYYSLHAGQVLSPDEGAYFHHCQGGQMAIDKIKKNIDI